MVCRRLGIRSFRFLISCRGACRPMFVGEGFGNRFRLILSWLLSVRNVKDSNVRSGDSRELEALDNGGERVYILEDRRILKERSP